MTELLLTVFVSISLKLQVTISVPLLVRLYAFDHSPFFNVVTIDWRTLFYQPFKFFIFRFCGNYFYLQKLMRKPATDLISIGRYRLLFSLVLKWIFIFYSDRYLFNCNDIRKALLLSVMLYPAKERNKIKELYSTLLCRNINHAFMKFALKKYFILSAILNFISPFYFW